MPLHPNVRRCTHIQVTGHRCGSPALKQEYFCYFHTRMIKGVQTRVDSQIHPIALIESAEAIQAAIMHTIDAVLKGTIEIRVKVGAGTLLSPSAQGADLPPIILDWRKIRGSETLSTISNVLINGTKAVLSSNFSWPLPPKEPAKAGTQNEYYESNDHLIFRDGVITGENVIKLDFTSPILTSGSAITRYVDKEDGAEYIYSLFVPSDASTAFPVFDQPDLKAR